MILEEDNNRKKFKIEIAQTQIVATTSTNQHKQKFPVVSVRMIGMGLVDYLFIYNNPDFQPFLHQRQQDSVRLDLHLDKEDQRIDLEISGAAVNWKPDFLLELVSLKKLVATGQEMQLQ